MCSPDSTPTDDCEWTSEIVNGVTYACSKAYGEFGGNPFNDSWSGGQEYFVGITSGMYATYLCKFTASYVTDLGPSNNVDHTSSCDGTSTSTYTTPDNVGVVTLYISYDDMGVYGVSIVANGGTVPSAYIGTNPRGSNGVALSNGNNNLAFLYGEIGAWNDNLGACFFTS